MLLPTVLVLALAANGAPQQPAAPSVPPPVHQPSAPRLGVRFDARGWPVVDDAPAAPGLESRPAPPATAAPAPSTALASGAATAGLAQVFAAVASPAAFAGLGGITAGWRLTVHGQQGEVVGVREMAHRADAAAADRDRLEFADGRACGRLGAAVFAERHGMPWPTLAPAAAHELALIGLHLRLPWAFADRSAFAEAGTDVQTRGGESFLRVRLMRRTEPRALGPSREEAAADTFELWCSESGLPRELVHTLAGSGQRRRVLLEDWRQVQGVPFPFRRVYVDAAGRPTTTLELLRLEAGAAFGEQDFRLR